MADGAAFELLNGFKTSTDGIRDAVVSGAENIDAVGAPNDAVLTSIAEMRETITNLQNTVSALLSNQTSQANNGVSYTDNFNNDPDLSTPPTIYTKIHDSGGGSVVTLDGAIDWSGGHVVGRELYIYPDLACLSDYFETEMVIPRRPEYDPGAWYSGPSTGNNANYLIGRSNTDGTSFCFAKVGYGKVRIGCVVAGSTTITAPTWFAAETAVALPSASRVRFRGGTVNGVRIFQVEINGITRVQAIDSGAVSMLGEDYRYCGFGLESDSSFLAGSIGLWGFNDNPPTGVTILGTGFKIYRYSWATYTLPAGYGLLPNGFFDSVAVMTEGIEFDPANNNAITIPVSDWWIFTYNLTTGSYGAGEAAAGAIYQEGSVTGMNNTAWMPTGDVTGSGSGGLGWTGSVENFVSQGTHLLYCEAGDVIQPGFYHDGAGTVVLGDVNGYLTQLTGAPLGRGINT